MKTLAAWLRNCSSIGWLALNAEAASSFINFETAPVHPLALSPDSRVLAVCNLPDRRVELFDVSGEAPVSVGNVPVGVDPVSLRFRTTNELWVVNHISSTVNIVNIAGQRVAATLDTKAGSADVVFAGAPQRAFISCSKENTVQVFDPVSHRPAQSHGGESERKPRLCGHLRIRKWLNYSGAAFDSF